MTRAIARMRLDSILGRHRGRQLIRQKVLRIMPPPLQNRVLGERPAVEVDANRLCLELAGPGLAMSYLPGQTAGQD